MRVLVGLAHNFQFIQVDKVLLTRVPLLVYRFHELVMRFKNLEILLHTLLTQVNRPRIPYRTERKVGNGPSKCLDNELTCLARGTGPSPASKPNILIPLDFKVVELPTNGPVEIMEK